MHRIITIVSFLFLSLICMNAQDAFEYRTFVSAEGDSLDYRMISPENMKTKGKYPLVLFLHGAGERGNDNERQMVHGSQMFLNPVNREKYPAFVLFPQCPQSGYWAYESRPASFTDMPAEVEISRVFKTLKQLLDSYIANPNVDASRVYIMGLSMGAMGTFDMVIRFPEVFAAAVPICGTVNPGRLAAAKDVKFRIFHGDADDVVPVECSRKAYKALKAAGADVEYIEFPGCNHGSWNPAFSTPDFMKWLFKQKK